MAVLQFCILMLLVISTKSSYMFSNMLTLDSNGNYNVSWNFNASSDTLEFLVEANATGWVGFGVAENAPTGMVDYDVAIGGVLGDGTGYLQDYLTIGQRTPQLDTQQDWMRLNSSEENGVTTLKFYRKRNTTDQQNDTAIPVGMPIYVIWAYHATNDSLQEHDERGVKQVTLIPAVTSTTSMMMAMTTTTPAQATATEVMSVSTSSLVSPSMSTSTTPTPTPAPTTSSVYSPASDSQQGTVESSITPTTTAITQTPTSASIVMPMPMPQPMHFSNFLSLKSGKYNVSWMFNSSMNTLHFMVEVMTTGWIGLGFSTQMPPTDPKMMGYDVAIGTVVGGVGELKDYLTVGTMPPQLDNQQDWRLTYSSENNGVTKLRFYRKLNTTEENDVVIQPGIPVYLIWAYHSSSDTIQNHGSENRGFPQVTLIPAINPTTSSSPPMTPTAMNTPVPTAPMPQPMHFSNFLSLKSGKYNVSWMFNSSMNTLHFMVEVMTTGWIGLGFSTQMPPTDPSMMGYDVAIGRVVGGVGELKDYLTIGRTMPRLDNQQDWTLTYSSENNGVTKLRFYRKLNTADQNDVVIQPGIPVYLIWAYHSSSDTIQNHGSENRGFPQVTLVVKDTTQFTHSYDNNRFRLLWKFDDQNDKLTYHLRVKTTGWVEFGFAKTAPNNMRDYDIIVGGFKDGKGYLYDYYTQGRSQPSPDSKQDYKLLSASEAGGYTELMFERARDTGDSNDIQFEVAGQVHLIWAYGVNDVTDESTFNQHSVMGWSDKLVIVGEAPLPTKAAASCLHSRINAIAAFAIVLLNVLAM